MKLSIITLTLALISQHAVDAFVVSPSSVVAIRPITALAVDLTPEPEGGDELTAIKTMPGSRVKNMGEVEGVTDDNGTVYSFWLTATAAGSLVKELNTKILKDASKNADFPGFRKGQIPPYAMPQIRGFAVQEGIIQTVQSAVNAYGLKSLTGSNGEVEVLEDVPEIAKSYKVGDDIQFTATFNGILDPEVQPAAAAAPAADETVIDAEVEEVE